MFDFRLKVFYTVAERLSFTRAAEELCITQPAVTRHIREIEQHYKVKLFDRNGSRISLTPAGKILLQHARELFALYSNLEFELSSLNEEQGGQLRVGASTTIAQYVLPPLLAAFHQRFPGIRIHLSTGNSGQVAQMLEQKQIDIGVVEGYTRDSAFQYTRLVGDELVLTAAAGHRLAKKGSIRPDALRELPLVLREPGSGTLEVVAHALAPLGIRLADLHTEIELGSTEGIKAYLQHSEGLAFLSIHAILKELKHHELCVIEIEGLRIDRDLFLIQSQGDAAPLPALFLKYALRYNFR